MLNPGDSNLMDPNEGQDPNIPENEFKNLTLEDHPPQSQGEPRDLGMNELAAAGYSGGGGGSSRSTPEKSTVIKGILKNREMRSPVAPNALDYNGPADVENVRDNNYEENDQRFSSVVVDSRELFARKVRAGLVKKRVRSTSTESAPELTFYPKRQDDSDDGGGRNGEGGGQSHRTSI